MEIQPLGFVVLAVGILTVMADYGWAIFFALALTVLGGAGAIALPVLGGATITPPHLFAGFLALKALLQQNGLAAAFEALTPRRPGAWFALVVCYGTFIAIIAPGLFPDALVYAFGRVGSGASVRLEPLTYGPGQITQGVYAFGAIIMFAAGTALIRRPGAWRYVLRGLIACTVLNLIFAAVDLASSGTDLLGFIRTGGYGQLSQETGGLKRIAGSFPEASAFAAYSCVLLAFWSSLWIRHYKPRLSGGLALAILAAMLLSTSSTAYLAVAVLATCFVAADILALVFGRRPQRLGFIAVAGPLLVFLALVTVLLRPDVVDAAMGVLGEAVFNKSTSASALERFTWNSQAWQDFADTYGIGIGIGATRTSSYLLTLLSNVGLVGTIAFAVFAYKTISCRNFNPVTQEEQVIGLACRWAFAGSLISAAVSAGVFELGALTYLCAAAAAAISYREAGARERVTLRSARPSIAAPR